MVKIIALVLWCLLSCVSGGTMLDKLYPSMPDEESDVSPGEDDSLISFINMAIIDHVQDMLSEMSQDSETPEMSGKMGFGKFYCFGKVKEKYRSCNKKCNKLSKTERTACKLMNFANKLVACFSGSMECDERWTGTVTSKVGECNSNCNCGIPNERHQKIYGGSEVEYEVKYPWHVGILNTKKGKTAYCGGTIVGDKYVITAAHCLQLQDIDDKDFSVRIGDHIQTSTDDIEEITKTIPVEKIHYHPENNKNTYVYDIALLELSQTITFTNEFGIRPICLPCLEDTDDYEGKSAITLGWGKTKHDSFEIPETLKQAEVTILDKDCENKLVRAVTTEDEARQMMQELDTRGSQECTTTVKASWAYGSDITEEHKEAQLSAKLKYAEWSREQWERIKAVPKTTWEKFQDEDLKRKFNLMSILGTAALDVDDLSKFNNLVTKMSEIYSTAKICDLRDTEKCDLSLEPDLTRILRTSRDYEELEYVWKTWRHETGRLMRDHYKEFVHLANKAAKLNDFDNMGDMWTHSYETDNFKDIMEDLWEQLKPLYQQVHAYVRRKLREEYGEERLSKRGPIPAHLLGNMWSQTWVQIYDFVIPYPDKASIDVTPEMIKQNYTAQKMFELSDEFFTSLNLIPMPNKFWNHSIIEKPEGRELTCHASAWNFCNGQDFRIKQCTVVTMEDLITVHHEMGHIQYYLQYMDQPLIYREGANPGFHEAVGDVLALSVATPKHLKKIGLLQEIHNDEEADINFLMSMALDKIVFLPFGYLMDRWRWNVFSGETDMKDRNCDWWDLRYKIQGIKPPVQRSEADFDPGAKYHIPANVPYIRYFVSFVVQFQFHKALCLKANEYDPQDPMKPLHRCDIYQSTKAGKDLSEMLKLGSSKPWPEAMKALTGGDKMDASVIREYFMPLENWLKKDTKKHEEFIGWEKDDDEEYCVPTSS